jgi:hypothetical protein
VIQLKLALSTVNLLVKDGALNVDPQTDSSNAIFVTRASVEQCWIGRNTAKRARKEPVAAVPVDEVARFTGHTRAQLMDLVRSGTLQQLASRRACQLTATSLRAWMDSQDPEDVAVDAGNDQTARRQPPPGSPVVALRPSASVPQERSRM